MAYLDSMTSNGCPAAGLDADRKGPAVSMATNGAFKDIFCRDFVSDSSSPLRRTALEPPRADKEWRAQMQNSSRKS